MKSLRQSRMRSVLLILLLAVLALVPALDSASESYAARAKVRDLKVTAAGKNVTKRAVSLQEGAKQTLKVSAKPKAAAKSAKFRSSDTSVVTVSKSGRLTAKKAGTARIRITVSGKRYQKASTWVQVKVTPSSAGQGGQSQPADPAQPSNPSAGNGKTAVVYFSATGNTRSRAQQIVRTLGSNQADLIEITLQDPYTSDDLNWTNTNSRVDREYDQRDAEGRVPVRPELSEASKSVDLSRYDRVIIGYPIWWYDAAWPTWSFLDYHQKELAGKTLIPFCTSSSSSIDRSVSTLKAFYPNINIDSVHASRLGSDSAAASWAAGLR